MENETEIKTEDELKTILRVTKNPNGDINTSIRGSGEEVFEAISWMVLSILNSGFDVSLLYSAFEIGIGIYDEKRKVESDEH